MRRTFVGMLLVCGCEIGVPNGEATVTSDEVSEDGGKSSARGGMLTPKADESFEPSYLIDAELEDTIVPDAAIWNTISIDEDGDLLISAMQHQQLYLYHYSPQLEQVGDRVMLADHLPEGQMADLAQTFYDGVLYITLSDAEADDLYIMAVLPSGRILHSLQPVIEGSEMVTNDMHLVADEEGVHVLWGEPGYEKMCQTFSHSLELVVEPTVLLSSVRTAQLGTTIAEDDAYWMFAGDETNHQIQVSRWGRDWQQEGEAEIVVPMEEGNPSWNWFPSGVAHHTDSDTWFIAYTHMEEDESADDDATIRLATLDSDLNLVDVFDVTEKNGYTRPHLALSGDTLYLTYDGDEVYIKAFVVESD